MADEATALRCNRVMPLRPLAALLLAFGFFALALVPAAAQEAGKKGPEQRGRGLHGYIGFSASQPEDPSAYGMGMGFYSAVWTLVDQPLAHFQIGLASGWILPDNRDNRDYMPQPTSGELIALDSAPFVTPPEGMEFGYVPIVTRQEKAG